ncbi:MAG: hypothetical protein US42_C0016G0018 [Candidatus Magasanikbacteria bacterium GW2011_GWC2_37_14]|uniref:Uncharacterized protein n=1 Tax=Candidatus Magasanikbacteria bacterium GW2011_GWC2_37_14 TaxID=1619046 RepID=A0A0G0G7D5_9BACT|nr:MAG: hypothetical protein US42_C0016G0018 [Candidatus Magasanikbacteria bacterium GW2011_GWC2_37_14]
MFWHKNLKNNWILLFFTLIALGIVLSTVVILLIFIKKVNNQQFNTEVSSTVKQLNYNIGSAEVSARYLDTWANWQKEWDLKTDKEKYLLAFKENLESMRVPIEKLDIHLKIYLEWQKIQKDLSQKDLLEIKNQVNTWIGELTKVN